MLNAILASKFNDANSKQFNSHGTHWTMHFKSNYHSPLGDLSLLHEEFGLHFDVDHFFVC